MVYDPNSKSHIYAEKHLLQNKQTLPTHQYLYIHISFQLINWSWDSKHFPIPYDLSKFIFKQIDSHLVWGEGVVYLLQGR